MRSQTILGIIFIGLVILGISLGVYSWWIARHASVVIEWSTASELDTDGFNIYRSNNIEGELVKINDQPIPPSTEPLTGGDYRFTDVNVQAGILYYYWLEDLEKNGNSARHGPIEIRAQSGGIYELWLSVLLLILALIGCVMSFGPKQFVVETSNDGG